MALPSRDPRALFFRITVYPELGDGIGLLPFSKTAAKMAALRNDFLDPIARLSPSFGGPGSDLLRHVSPRRFASQRTHPPASPAARHHRESKPRRNYNVRRSSSLSQLRALLKKVERCLDRGIGCCYLSDPRVAAVAAETLRHFHGQRYRLLAWCVMPNHVHVLFSPLREHTLDAILHSWKSFSAQQANAFLGRTGPFWQREYFDHVVRDQSSLRKITQYIRDNPKRAGLPNWPWVEVL